MTVLTHEQKVAKLQEACKRDLKFLCKEVLGMEDWQDGFHDDLAQWLEWSGKEKLILEPRGHLKSSIVTVGWTIQQILREPNTRILINNAVWDNARVMLFQIQEYLTFKSALPTIFGEFKGPRSRWTRDEVDIAQRTKALREATVMTGGVESAKTGLHFNVIINDDIVIRENVTTREQIDKVINFHRDCYALLDPGGVIVNIGTRWAMQDLYGHLMLNEMRSLNRHTFSTEEERLEWRKVLAS